MNIYITVTEKKRFSSLNIYHCTQKLLIIASFVKLSSLKLIPQEEKHVNILNITVSAIFRITQARHKNFYFYTHFVF